MREEAWAASIVTSRLPPRTCNPGRAELWISASPARIPFQPRLFARPTSLHHVLTNSKNVIPVDITDSAASSESSCG